MTHERETRSEAGLTMVELLVAMIISVIVIALVSGVFINALRASAATTDRDAATGSVQVITNSVQTSIRNSSGFDLSGSVLRARVASGDGDAWRCREWRLTADHKLQYRDAGAKIPAGSETPAWTTLATGVRGATDENQPFTVNGSELQLSLKVTVGTATVAATGGATALASGTGSPASCW